MKMLALKRLGIMILLAGLGWTSAAFAQTLTTRELKYRFVVPVVLDSIQASKAAIVCRATHHGIAGEPKWRGDGPQNHAIVDLVGGAFRGEVRVDVTVAAGQPKPTVGDCHLFIHGPEGTAAQAKKSTHTATPEWARARAGTEFAPSFSVFLGPDGRPQPSAAGPADPKK
jgi:hypothetical protein